MYKASLTGIGNRSTL